MSWGSSLSKLGSKLRKTTKKAVRSVTKPVANATGIKEIDTVGGKYLGNYAGTMAGLTSYGWGAALDTAEAAKNDPVKAAPVIAGGAMVATGIGAPLGMAMLTGSAIGGAAGAGMGVVQGQKNLGSSILGGMSTGAIVGGAVYGGVTAGGSGFASGFGAVGKGAIAGGTGFGLGMGAGTSQKLLEGEATKDAALYGLQVGAASGVLAGANIYANAAASESAKVEYYQSPSDPNAGDFMFDMQNPAHPNSVFYPQADAAAQWNAEIARPNFWSNTSIGSFSPQYMGIADTLLSGNGLSAVSGLFALGGAADIAGAGGSIEIPEMEMPSLSQQYQSIEVPAYSSLSDVPITASPEEAGTQMFEAEEIPLEDTAAGWNRDSGALFGGIDELVKLSGIQSESPDIRKRTKTGISDEMLLKNGATIGA